MKLKIASTISLGLLAYYYLFQMTLFYGITSVTIKLVLDYINYFLFLFFLICSFLVLKIFFKKKHIHRTLTISQRFSKQKKKFLLLFCILGVSIIIDLIAGKVPLNNILPFTGFLIGASIVNLVILYHYVILCHFIFYDEKEE